MPWVTDEGNLELVSAGTHAGRAFDSRSLPQIQPNRKQIVSKTFPASTSG